MSIEEQNQPEQEGKEETVQPAEVNTAETSQAEPAAETSQAEPAAAAPKAEDKKEKATAAVGQIFSSIANLKQQNPKVFYGAVGGVVLLVLYLMFSGKPEVLSGPAQANLVVGQSYVLKTPNSAGESPQVRMVSTPGQMEAYDDTEETDRQGCKNLPEGTHVTVKDLFKQPGMNFAKVEINEGECKGKIMWTLAVNVH